MLEQTSAKRTFPTPAALEEVPLERTLALARARIRRIRIRAAALGSLAGALPLWVLALVYASDSARARALAIAVPLAGLAAFLVLGPLWLWPRSRTDEEMARLLGGRATGLDSALVSAVQLQAELRTGSSGFSEALARAHIAQTAERASRLDLRQVLPGRPARNAGWGALGAGVLALVLLAIAPRAIWAGLHALVAPARTGSEIAENLPEPITYEIELTYVYPAYTGLPSKTVPGTTGEISAPAGTQVHLKTRADRDVAKAAIAVGDQILPLEVANKRDLQGTLLVQKPGSYTFRFLDARGHLVAQGPPIPIAVEVDAPPKVTVYAPAPDVEVDPRGEVVVRYDAQDDYGLQSLELVYKIGGAPEQRLPLQRIDGPTRHASGDFHWAMPPLGLSPGDRVTYRVEARDTDTVNGPKLGKSRDQVLQVYSEAEHHRLALERVQKLWEEMIGQLALNLDAPDRTKPDGYLRPGSTAADARGPAAFLTDALAARSVDEKGDELVNALVDAAADLRKDRAAPKEIPRALANITGTLSPTTRSLADARGMLERWSRPGVPDPAATRRLSNAAEAQIAELERDTIYLEKLLDHRRIEDIQALAKELSARRRDLAKLLEKYQKAPDAQTRAAITQEIARMKERIGDLMQRMAELSRGISDEHMNADALAQMAKNDSMLGALDKVQQLMKEGKVDEAMKELQKLGDEMEQLQHGLDRAQGGFEGRQDPELARQFSQFNQQLQQVADQQRKVEKQARALKQQSQADLKKTLEQKGPEFAEALRQKVDDARKKLAQLGNAPGAEREGEDLEQAQESAEQLDHALAAKDFDAAAEEAARALSLAQQLEGDLKFDATRARRFPGLTTATPQQLDQAGEQARQGVQPLADVKKQLDQLFPKGSQNLSPEQRQQMQQLQSKQAQLEQQAQQLQQQMDQIGKKAPIFSPQMKGQMQGASQAMQKAEGAMAQRDPNGAKSHAEDAALDLEQLQRGVQQAMKGGSGGGGMMLPMPMGDSEGDEGESGNGELGQNEKVEIPDADKNENGEAYRKDIMDAMKQGAPARYKEQVKKYYEEIVK